MRNKLFAGALALAMTCTTVFSGVAPATVKAASVSTVQTQATENSYVYCYAGLTWDEYWKSEGVYNANNTSSSDILDSHNEYDKGAFDAVTRATSNHGLHRGNFQCIATVYDVDGTSYNLAYWADKTHVVLTDGTTIGLSKGVITLTDGTTTKKVDHYKVTGIKYVPVKVKSSDFEAFKAKYSVVENNGDLKGGYGEGTLSSYTETANVTANTNGLKTVTKNNDGTFSFSTRQTGIESGIKDAVLKTVDTSKITGTLKETNGVGSYGEFIRLDFTGDAYSDLGANMQAVKWTYYGDDSTYTKAVQSYGTKFAADNWMHKSMGIQLGLTDSLRCKLPEDSNGTGYWTVTVYALGYQDFTYNFKVEAKNLPADDASALDTSKLESLVKEAQALNASDYTTDSWNASGIELELQEAVDLLAAEQKNQASINEQCTHLTAAMKALVKKQAPTTAEKKDNTTTASKSDTTTASKPATKPALKKANVKLSKPVLKVGKTTKNKAKVTWKKVKKATGYEIQYTTKGFGNKKATKTIKVSKAKITSAQLKKLKKKTRYKVRIRAVYTKAGYQTATSKWSAIKTVKTK